MSKDLNEKEHDNRFEINQFFINTLEDLAKEAAFIGNRKLSFTYHKVCNVVIEENVNFIL